MCVWLYNAYNENERAHPKIESAQTKTEKRYKLYENRLCSHIGNMFLVAPTVQYQLLYYIRIAWNVIFSAMAYAYIYYV